MKQKGEASNPVLWVLLGMLFSVVLFMSLPVECADYTPVRETVHKIVARKSGGDWGNASMVVLREDLAVTNYHVIQQIKAARASDPFAVVRGSPRYFEVVALDKTADLALLRGDFGCPCAEVSTVPPEVDEDAISIGFPIYSQVAAQFAVQGNIQAVKYDVLLADTPTVTGASGGGLFVKQNGVYKLVGVIRAVGGKSIAAYDSKGNFIGSVNQLVPYLAFHVPVMYVTELLGKVSK